METWTLFADLLGNKYTLFVALISDVLCIFTGMSFAWSSPVLVKLNSTDDNPLGNPITQDENDWIGSVFSIGGAIGPLMLIYALELLGRKYTMTIIATIFPIFHMLLAFSKNIYLYYVSRVALGVAVGGSFSIVAVYIGEISSTRMRGTYLSLGTSFILTGCLISYSIGPYVSIFTFNLIIAISSLLYIPLFLLSCPESLYYTMQKYGEEKTLTILRKLRRNHMEFEELEKIRESVSNEVRGSYFDIFKSKAGIKAFFICTTLLVLQQFCGITVIITYSQQLFKDADVSLKSEICTIIISAIQVSTCFITPVAAKYFNRKLLLSLSFAGIVISNALMGVYFTFEEVNNYKWIPLVSLISFVIFYNCGVGPLPWATLGELYPLNVKSVGTALSNTIYWIFQFLLTFYFNKIDKGVSFFIFSFVCLLAIGFVQIFLIETRGKSLQDIQRRLEK